MGPGTTPQQWAMARVNSMLKEVSSPDLQPKLKIQKKSKRRKTGLEIQKMAKSGKFTKFRN